ncbi:dynamin family protein [Pseudoruegeria sp. SK021]|uniref:dynamin family protein n=1 Tax=Pseudoruegeria sp. SK021 TaxID=1933035 RepID=UPI000A25F074|nr:dynamin family protein [Pseudoruegeria sp. SK021]OSP54590.1 hypothetical protein BV911_12070 [Pseudoruegeria sp. SK021]
MRPGRRLRQALLRWDRLISALVVTLPLVATCLFGFLWLSEHGWLLPFITLCAVVGGAVYLARRWLRPPRQQTQDAADMREALSVEADPDWSAAETTAFSVARKRIEALTDADLPWEDLPKAALDVVNDIATGLGGPQKTALDFTLPEALLLIERAATRYRSHLRRHVPFSDQVSLKTLIWIWGQRDRAQMALSVARIGHRLARLAISPTTAVLREIEQAVAGGNATYLNDQVIAVLQAVLLEEVAYAAVELYSGRLKFSDAELLAIQMASTDADRGRAALPDAPLRVVVVGQISAGKSSLINALLPHDLAEIDMQPTTDRLTTYETEIDGIACHLIDTQGLDGGPDAHAATLTQMTRSDMVVWVLRANRPARAPDLALRHAFDAWVAAHPARRSPAVIAVATCIDQLAPGWPFPEHALPDPALSAISTVVTAMAADTGLPLPLPVSVVSPVWNIAALHRAIAANLGTALLVQRNRRRVGADETSGGVLSELRRGGRGLVQTGQILGGRLASKALKTTAKEGRKDGDQDGRSPEPKA